MKIYPGEQWFYGRVSMAGFEVKAEVWHYSNTQVNSLVNTHRVNSHVTHKVFVQTSNIPLHALSPLVRFQDGLHGLIVTIRALYGAINIGRHKCWKIRLSRNRVLL